MALYVLLDNDCLIRIYQLSIIRCNSSKIFPIMLALSLMLSVTYYAQNYAGIIGWSLDEGIFHSFKKCNVQTNHWIYILD